MKRKYCKKDKKVVKKSKAPASKKKIVSKKKAIRKQVIRIEDVPADLAPGSYDVKVKSATGEIVTLGFEQAASDPIEPDQQAEIIEPDAVTEAA